MAYIFLFMFTYYIESYVIYDWLLYVFERQWRILYFLSGCHFIIKTAIKFYNIHIIYSFFQFRPFDTQSYSLPYHLLVWPLQAFHNPSVFIMLIRWVYSSFTIHTEVQFGDSYELCLCFCVATLTLQLFTFKKTAYAPGVVTAMLSRWSFSF